eukprot:jgi/Mesen1/9572/ME000065S09002
MALCTSKMLVLQTPAKRLKNGSTYVASSPSLKIPGLTKDFIRSQIVEGPYDKSLHDLPAVTEYSVTAVDHHILGPGKPEYWCVTADYQSVKENEVGINQLTSVTITEEPDGRQWSRTNCAECKVADATGVVCKHAAAALLMVVDRSATSTTRELKKKAKQAALRELEKVQEEAQASALKSAHQSVQKAQKLEAFEALHNFKFKQEQKRLRLHLQEAASDTIVAHLLSTINTPEGVLLLTRVFPGPVEEACKISGGPALLEAIPARSPPSAGKRNLAALFGTDDSS